MAEDRLTRAEVKELGYYDFLAYIGIPFYHVGGLKSTEKLAEMGKIDAAKKVLMVGCGTGYSACHLVKEYECYVVGIDIAEKMILKAKERAKIEEVNDRVEFRVADAYALPFENNSFDLVMTEFVSLFLEKEKAFKEFVRVLKPGGFVGLNELYKAEEIPEKEAKKIEKAEENFSEAVELPFDLPSPGDWKRWLEEASLIAVRVEEQSEKGGAGELFKSMGGFWTFFKMFFKVLYYYFSSKKIRKRWSRMQGARRTFFRWPSTSKYVGYVLCIGRKP